MTEISIYRADGLGPNESVPPVTIRIDKPMPGFNSSDDARARFKADGDAIAEALWSVLPGGTVDALIGDLLARRASLLRVRFPQES
jgi:hypothetical protein